MAHCIHDPFKVCDECEASDDIPQTFLQRPPIRRIGEGGVRRTAAGIIFNDSGIATIAPQRFFKTDRVYLTASPLFVLCAVGNEIQTITPEGVLVEYFSIINPESGEQGRAVDWPACHVGAVIRLELLGYDKSIHAPPRGWLEGRVAL